MAYDVSSQKWLLCLNRYQRDNLRWLLEEVIMKGPQPFNLLNTGDWVGEIAWMLDHEKNSEYADRQYVFRQTEPRDTRDLPNKSLEQLRNELKNLLDSERNK